LFAKFFEIPTPSYSNIRNWVLRAGLYQLLQIHKNYEDWIFILDMTIKLGTVKCLIILGIRKSYLDLLLSQPDFKGLKHSDVDVVVLSLEILFSTKGEFIEQCLDKLSDKVGVPMQIISDHGSDLKKGIELFVEKHPKIIYTYDVTHYMALLFKAELETDERYQSFLKPFRYTRTHIQQTKLKPFVPPPQKKKSRYLNVEELIDWGTFILNYEAKGDFSDIRSQWKLESDSYESLKDQVNNKAYNELKSLVNQTYQSQQNFEIALNAMPLDNKERQVICERSNLGQKYFNQKLGWILEYKDDIPVYSKMVDLVHLAEKQLSHHGISQDSLAIENANTDTEILTPRLKNFKNGIDDYLVEESSKIPPNDILWPNSNVIESLFGKYKFFISIRPLQEISKLILIIPLCTIEITGQFIKDAMETISIKHVEWWAEHVFGKSSLSKKKAILQSVS